MHFDRQYGADDPVKQKGNIMTRGISYIRRAKRFGRDQAGMTAVLFALTATGLTGMLGSSIDVGHVLAMKGQLNARVQADALVGARALAQTNATSSTVGTAVTTWDSQKPLTNVTVTNTTTTLACVSATTNLPSCNGTNPNSVKVTQTATVSTYFLKIFGIPQFSLTSSATAAMAGGAGTPMQIMFVLDATASMGTTKDPGCTDISNATRYQCAAYSIQQVMIQLQPSLTKVGLMAFPGSATQFNPTSPCPTQPSSTPYYSANIHYQIGVGLDSTYNNGSGVLVDSSPMVRAVGDNVTSQVGCLTAKGGQGSYIAEVLTKAQAALPVIAGTENVIILLSDGDTNANSAQLSSHSTSKQCGASVTAADAAAAAGTTIYSVAYGAPLSGCSINDTYTPCTAMQAIASDPTKFFSTNSNCAISGSPNSAANLPAILRQITTSLSKPRLVLN
jgi:Flp pilus assembly protein TadG